MSVARWKDGMIRILKNKSRIHRIRKGYIKSHYIIVESVKDSRDLASYITARRGPAGSYLIITYNHTHTKTLETLPLYEITTTQPFGCPIVIDFTYNQDQVGRM
jgi:hypothetical protein